MELPVVMGVWKVGPALAAGNSVVLKPARRPRAASLRLAELALEAGVPAGVFNVVTGVAEVGRRAGRGRGRGHDVADRPTPNRPKR